MWKKCIALCQSEVWSFDIVGTKNFSSLVHLFDTNNPNIWTFKGKHLFSVWIREVIIYHWQIAMRHCTVNGQCSQVCFRSEPFKNQSTGHCVRRGLITFAEMEALAVSHKQCGQLPTAAFFLAVIKGQANSAPWNFSKHSPATPQS